jgi:hypothetical protein
LPLIATVTSEPAIVKMNGELIAFTVFFTIAVVVVLAELLSLEPHPAANSAANAIRLETAKKRRLIKPV